MAKHHGHHMPSCSARVTVPELIDRLTLVFADMRFMDDLGDAPSHVENARAELIKLRELALQVVHEQEGSLSDASMAMEIGAVTKPRRLS